MIQKGARPNFGATYDLAGVESLIKNFAAKSRNTLSTGELAQLLLQILGLIGDAATDISTIQEPLAFKRYHQFSQFVYRTPPGTGGSPFFNLAAGFNAENLRFADLGGLSPGAAAWDPINDGWITDPSFEDAVREVWTGDNLVDTSTGRIWKYMFDYTEGDLANTGSGAGPANETYDAGNWSLVYDPSGTLYTNLADDTLVVTIPARTIVNNVVFVQTDVIGSPVVTVEVSGGGETFLNEYPLEADGTLVWTPNLFLNAETDLDVTTNFDCEVRVLGRKLAFS